MKIDEISKKRLVDATDAIIKKSTIGKNNVETRIIVSPKRLKLPDNIMVFQAFAYLSATKLKASTNRVLMLLFSKSMYENFISMDILTIAEELKIHKSNVIMALNELVENNIIIKVKHPSDKRRNDYFINPLAAWKGNSFARKKSIGAIKDPNQLLLFGQESNEHSLLSMSEKKLPLAERK